MITYAADPYEPQRSRREMAEDAKACDECGRDTDPDDAAPSCGAHVVCVPCYTTSDFRCGECLRVWLEIERDMARDARAEG